MRNGDIWLTKLKLRLRDKHVANHKAPYTAIWQQTLQLVLAVAPRIKRLKINPCRYSPEEIRSTEVIAVRWQYKGPCGKQSAYPPTLISGFLTGFRYFSYQVANQLFSRGWVDPILDPILPEKFLGHSRESNPGPLGWQSDVLTTIAYQRGGQILVI